MLTGRKESDFSGVSTEQYLNALVAGVSSWRSWGWNIYVGNYMECPSEGAFLSICRFYSIIVGVMGMTEEIRNWRPLALASHVLATLVLAPPSFALFVYKNKEVAL